ncbi:MAG: type IV pilus assembly protein PilM [Planctomycetota bacterium]|nr:type IV pilus assembly protein PilM [Planctomycetota bacterium]
MLGQAKSVIGIDMGTSAVKAVEMSMEGGSPVLTGFGHVDVRPGEGPEVALRELLASGSFRSTRASMGVGGQSTVVRYLEMVRMSEAELRQAIPFELQSHLPFEVDEVTYDCQALELGSPMGQEDPAQDQKHDTMTVLLAACRKDLIEERLNWVQQEGLTPVAVNLDLFALANAWELAGPAPLLTHEDEVGDGDSEPSQHKIHTERAVALVDVGAGRTSINVLMAGETCFSREIPLGGMDMTQAIARRLGVEAVEAEALKRESDGPSAEVEAAMSPVIEDLAAELVLSIDYVEHHRGVQVAELLVSGGGLLVPGAVQHLELAVGRPAHLWSPLEGLRINAERVDMEDLERWASSLVVALGLAGKVAA